MDSSRTTLVFVGFAPTLVRGDGRVLKLVHAVEASIPGVRLDWEVSDEGALRPLSGRDAWLMERLVDGAFPLLCNGDEDRPVTLSGWEKPAAASLGGQPQLQLHAELSLPPANIHRVMDVVEGLSEAARAFWAHATPSRAAEVIASQRGRSSPVPLGLPRLLRADDLTSPVIPHHLGWINFWSAATARALGFPDATRDAEWLSRSRRTATDGWVVQLTQAPLDLDVPEHLETLLRAYERFQVIGGRAPPRNT
ncbi:DUF5953 family protein [Myxococcus sp. K15C18031901]|uniref:DUF5953 family protein n=1 Tax=Myxococcus dinghuensis TaxID=2906761 RepID=UPI0020A76D2B|nr:DUF5953 family protein [Myxococcus dinghuensis]MCP3103123.1 DUF5953 family protein [Myxococcus dinghuensis]